jgi:hypothetical protein
MSTDPDSVTKKRMEPPDPEHSYYLLFFSDPDGKFGEFRFRCD